MKIDGILKTTYSIFSGGAYEADTHISANNITKVNKVKVKNLIEFLEKQDQELPVAYEIYSEQCLLKDGDIKIKSLCAPRADGWVANQRDDKPSIKYLVFPGD